MKRIFTLLILSSLFFQAQSQSLFFQDFESGSIAPMTALDIDGKVLDLNVVNLSPTWDVFSTSATNLSVLSTSWFTPIGKADDWLISPELTITDTNTFLIWEANAYGAPPYQDGYEVLVSTKGDSSIANFTDVLFTIAAESNDIQRRALKLDAYVGMSIHFAFRNNSFDKYILVVDNIEVKVLRDVDVTVKSVTFEKYNPVNTQVPIHIAIQNNGALPLTSLNFTWTVGDTTYTDTISGLNVATVQRSEITHTVLYNMTETGEFPVSVAVTSPNNVEDGNPGDNYGYRNLYGLNEQLAKKVVVEEGTGTWCGWCPRGFVAMEKIAEDFPELAIPIAIHNYDPMLVPEYDTPFSATIGGYPGGHVDRKELNIDPDHPNTGYGFVDALQNLDDRMVPVLVNIENTYTEETRMVHVIGTAHLSIPTQFNDLRFSAVITEDNVKGPSTMDPLTDYDQVNYYAGGANGAMGGFEALPNPVPASQMIYNFVARGLIGGYYGMENSIPDALQANEDFTFEFNYEVPANYNVDEMKVIVFVLDEETGEILNGNIVPLRNTTSIPLIPTGKSLLYPNPASDFVELSVDFQTNDPVSMKIYDTYGRLIKNLGNLDLSAGSKIEKIDVSQMHTGNYILELRYKNSVTALPFTRI